MARFLFTVWPFAGCVHPFIAVANALRQQGHIAAFYTGERCRELIERERFVLFPFTRLDESQVDHLVRSPAGIGANWSKPWRMGGQLRSLFLGTVPAQVADIRAILDSWHADVIVCDPALWGPFLILFEKDHVPVALCSYAGGCMLPGSGAPPVGLGLPLPRNRLQRLGNRLTGWAVDRFLSGTRTAANELRKQHGLPAFSGPVISLAAQLPLYLLPSCPEYDYNRTDLPPAVKYVGPLQWYPQQRHLDWPPGLGDGRPVVHVTEGTLHFQNAFVLRAAAEGLAASPFLVVATTGDDRDPAALGLPPASNLYVYKWLPHDELLPRCDVMVTTAGGGTVMAGLQHGVPMVVIPTEWDKAENAQRVVEAGAGIRLAPRECTPANLKRAVVRILENDSYRQNARRLATQLQRYGGAQEAAQHLSALVPSCATPGDRATPDARGDRRHPGNRLEERSRWQAEYL